MRTILHIDAGASMHSLTPLLGLGVRVAKSDDGTFWLRVDAVSQQDSDRIAGVAATRFQLADNTWLIRPGDKIASDRLPSDLNWERLDDVFQFELPPASFAPAHTRMNRRVMQLVRGGRPAEPAAIIAEISQFGHWVDTASEIRLRRLRWVWRGDEVLVMGNPLPPIEARYLVATDRVLVPAGCVWAPAVSVEDLKTVFSIDRDQWLVWESNQCWNAVDDDAFMSLRRASVRSFQAAGDRLAEGEAS